MKATVEKFESGWIGIALSLSPQDVEQLIGKLQALRQGDLGHFHVRQNLWGSTPGVADLEFSMEQAEEEAELSIE
jgi:hypothetical protein